MSYLDRHSRDFRQHLNFSRHLCSAVHILTSSFDTFYTVADLTTVYYAATLNNYDDDVAEWLVHAKQSLRL